MFAIVHEGRITTVSGNLTFRVLALRQRQIFPDERLTVEKSAFKPFRVVIRPLSTRFDKIKLFMFHYLTEAAAVSVKTTILSFLLN